LVAYGKESFLAVGADGGLAHVMPGGQTIPLRVRPAAPVAALARDPCSDAIAVGAGEQAIILPDEAPEDPVIIDIGEAVTALAFAPDGRRLAVGHARGVSFIMEGRLGEGVALDSAPQHLSFSPEGAWLACGLTEVGFALIDPNDLSGDVVADYPTAVRSFAWSRAARALATSGAFRTVAWALTENGFGDALEAGRNGLVVVERVAASPDRPLIAAGYASGLLCISKIGVRDEMMLRASGGAVSALAWGPDGTHLAFGDADGNAALLSFPPDIFK
jgi:WD40 repeat protein